MSTGLMVQFGLCIGAIVAMPEMFGTPKHWWLIYAFLNVTLFLVLLLLPFIYESPMCVLKSLCSIIFSYLLTKNEEIKAKKSIKFYGWGPEIELNANLKELQSSKDGKTKPLGMLDVVKGKFTLRGAIVGSLVAFAVGMSGVDGKFLGIYKNFCYPFIPIRLMIYKFSHGIIFG